MFFVCETYIILNANHKIKVISKELHFHDYSGQKQKLYVIVSPRKCFSKGLRS